MSLGCTVESCHFRDLIGEFKAVGAQPVGISADRVERQRHFAEKHSLGYSPAIFLLLVGFLNIRLGASIGKRAGVLLGDASYSIYLIHPLVFYSVYAVLRDPLPPVWTQEFLRFGSIAIVYAVSIASWKLFETPIIRFGNRLMNRSQIPNQLYQPSES
jgi:peptidoglycan/LPS O-acetylase OafA/YrhL